MSTLLSSITDFHFLRPAWLLALIPLAVAGWLLLRQRLATGRWRDAIDPELAGWMIEAGWRGTARLGLTALLMAWMVAVLALAGPTWERRPQPVAQSADALVVVFDLSLSMYAQDVSPSRLVRARLKISDILEQRRDGQTALVVYAGDAHTVVPLTDDTKTINNLLPALEPGLMPVLGARAEDAVAQAATLLTEAEAPDGRILLITDEILDAAPVIDAADGYPVSVLGIGSRDGAPIPLDAVGRSGNLSADGRTVIARLDPQPLQAIARSTGGRYSEFTTSSADLERLLDPAAAAEARADGDRDREFDLWIDRGPWLLWLVLPVALLMFRRGVVAALVLAALVSFTPTAPVHAASADALRNLFERPDQRAVRQLRRGESDAAAATFEDSDWRATALYRAEEYALAADAFTADGADADVDADADAQYNRGTALARAGRFEDARDAYDAALALAPEHEDALHNRDIVERLLEEQKQNAENEQGSQQEDPNGDEGNDSEASRRDEESSSQQSDDAQDNSEAGEGEPSQPEEQEAEGQAPEEGEQAGQSGKDDEIMAQRTREQEQALEQWLRRVPDEPGALLQRKFRYESDRRYRQGLRRAPEDAQAW